MSFELDWAKLEESLKGVGTELMNWTKLVAHSDLTNQVIAITGDMEFTLQTMLSSIADRDKHGTQLAEMLRMWEGRKSMVTNEEKTAPQKTTGSTKINGTESSFLKNSNKLLLIRPDKDSTLLPGCEPSHYVTEFSHPASDEVMRFTKENPRTVRKITDLDGDKATRTEVERALRDKNVSLVLHYDHGNSNVVYGQPFDQREEVIDLNNVNLLEGKSVSTVSCLSAAPLGLGHEACNQGARAYLGYSNEIWAPKKGKLTAMVVEAANAANLELLKGKTFHEAYQKGIDTYESNFKKLEQELQKVTNPFEWLKISLAARFLLWNKSCFTIIGDPATRAF